MASRQLSCTDHAAAQRFELPAIALIVVLSRYSATTREQKNDGVLSRRKGRDLSNFLDQQDCRTPAMSLRIGSINPNRRKRVPALRPN